MNPLALLLFFSLPTAAEFPIGLYNLNLPQAAGEVADAGFTHILPAEGDTLSRAVHAAGMKIVGIPRPVAAPRPPTSPSVAAWYISDEPEVNLQSTTTIAAIASSVRRWDPLTPLALVVGTGKYAGPYAPFVDVMMVDWYPVPHLPLTSAGDQISVALSQTGGKPVWAVLQAMDWLDYPQRNPNIPRIGRFPTRDEIRFMTYHAIVRGASGVFYFEFLRRYHDGQTLLDFPERWKSLTGVVGELKVLKPLLDLDKGALLTVPGLEGRRYKREGEELLILLNPTETETPIPQEYRSSDWVRLFGPGPIAPAISLGPYQVLVLSKR